MSERRTNQELRAAAAALESLEAHEGWRIVVQELERREAAAFAHLAQLTADNAEYGPAFAAQVRELRAAINYPTKRAAELRSLVTTEEADG